MKKYTLPFDGKLPKKILDVISVKQVAEFKAVGRDTLGLDSSIDALKAIEADPLVWAYIYIYIVEKMYDSEWKQEVRKIAIEKISQDEQIHNWNIVQWLTIYAETKPGKALNQTAFRKIKSFVEKQERLRFESYRVLTNPEHGFIHAFTGEVWQFYKPWRGIKGTEYEKLQRRINNLGFKGMVETATTKDELITTVEYWENQPVKSKNDLLKLTKKLMGF